MRHGVPGWFFVVAYILNTRESSAAIQYWTFLLIRIK